MSYTKEEIQEEVERRIGLNINEDYWAALMDEGLIPKPERVKNAQAIWSTSQYAQIETNLRKFKAHVNAGGQISDFWEVFDNDDEDEDKEKEIVWPIENLTEGTIAHFFMKYGERNPFQLVHFLGFKSPPNGLMDVIPVSVKITLDGIDFYIGIVGDPAIKNKVKNHVRVASDAEGKLIDGIDFQLVVSVDKRYVKKVLEVIANPKKKFVSTFFTNMKETFEWQKAKKRTPNMNSIVTKYTGRAGVELKRSDISDAKRLRYEKIIKTADTYWRLPPDNAAFAKEEEKSYKKKKKKSKKTTYRPRLPSGQRPTLIRGDNCDMIRQLLEATGCDAPATEGSSGQRNPIRAAKSGIIHSNGAQFKYKLDVIPIKSAITSHDDRLEPMSKYPYEFSPREITKEEYDKLVDLRENIVPEVMVLAGPTTDGPPIVWSRNNIVIEGSLRTIALRNSDPAVLSEYLGYVFGMTGKRGLMVRRLVGNKNEALKLINSVANKQAAVKNPIPMRRKNRMGKPEVKYRKKGNDKIPVYQDDENGYPHGAVPLDQLPASVKNHKSFKKSWEMFKARYGADPDYAIPGQSATGLSGVFAGVGELKQLDYWAAESANKPDDWIHWYHDAGERGEGVPFTRACIVAADPHTGRIVLIEPEGSDCKFTNRGIVG
jgi:hypothetical protein